MPTHPRVAGACRHDLVMSERRAIVEARRKEIRALVRQHKGRAAALFGSVARGEETATSDIDFLVDFEAGSSLLDLLHLQDELAALLGCPVDVVSVGGLKQRDAHIRGECASVVIRADDQRLADILDAAGVGRHRPTRSRGVHGGSDLEKGGGTASRDHLARRRIRSPRRRQAGSPRSVGGTSRAFESCWHTTTNESIRAGLDNRDRRCACIGGVTDGRINVCPNAALKTDEPPGRFAGFVSVRLIRAPAEAG